MYLGARCGRPIHSAPLHDTQAPVCLMHSRDPEKNDAEFQQQVDAILTAAAEKHTIADFTSFVFPSAKYAKREFSVACQFEGAAFLRGVNFFEASFLESVYFCRATVHEANFSLATFAKIVTFALTTFEHGADFLDARFIGECNFRGCAFGAKTRFYSARFEQFAHFEGASFLDDVDFNLTIFSQTAEFSAVTFAKEAKFFRATFASQALFRETNFRRDGEVLPGPRFSLAQFLRPGSTVFYRTYLGQAIFSRCDISNVTFSSVEWRLGRGNKRIVFEELVDLKAVRQLTPPAGSSDERDYGLIADLYQQLKKNYDDHSDYSVAGDFHCGELEMKRLHSEQSNQLLRWLHRYAGLVAWYKYASSYGESYVRPAFLLLIVLAVFTLLLPLAGLELSVNARQTMVAGTNVGTSVPDVATEVNYRHFREFLASHPGRCSGVAKFFGHSLMTALSVAGFQRELRYEPSYPWGRALALLELLCTSTLVALFLLAVRRQFRR